jgi:hypothetical protein
MAIRAMIGGQGIATALLPPSPGADLVSALRKERRVTPVPGRHKVCPYTVDAVNRMVLQDAINGDETVDTEA